MRTRFEAVDTNRVILTCDAERMDQGMDGTISIEYWSPSGGGYVYEGIGVAPRLRPPVCLGLDMEGHTLYWSGQTPLVDLIRREWKRARREELAAERRRERY